MTHKCYGTNRPSRVNVVALTPTKRTFWVIQYDSTMVLADVNFCPWCGILLNTDYDGKRPTPLLDAVRQVNETAYAVPKVATPVDMIVEEVVE